MSVMKFLGLREKKGTAEKIQVCSEQEHGDGFDNTRGGIRVKWKQW